MSDLSLARTQRGQARTEAERAVEGCLSKVAEWQGRQIEYLPVPGGLQNSNWRIVVDGDPVTYFLKIPGAGTEEFIDRNNSHWAAIRAGDLGISPRVVHYDADTGVEIIEFLDGYRACTNSDLKNWDTAQSVLQLQRQFHSIEPLPVTKTIFDLIDEHLDQAKSLNTALPSFAPALLRELAEARAAFEASGLDIVPCHNDPMPGNFLISAGKPMRLVDFEFSSNNERAYDLAVTFTEFFYDEPTIRKCIEITYGRADWDIVSRVQVASALADIKWGLWGCTYHQINDSWDYDYHKYGVWKLLRAHIKISDPRWAQWLTAI